MLWCFSIFFSCKRKSSFQLPILSPVAADVDALADSADNIKDPREKYRRLAPKNAKIIQCNPVKVNENSLDVQFTYGLPAQCKLTEGVKSKWQCTAFKDSLKEGAISESTLVMALLIVSHVIKLFEFNVPFYHCPHTSL